MGQEGVGEFIRGGSLQKRISLKLVWGAFTMGRFIRITAHTPIKRKYSYPKGWQANVAKLSKEIWLLLQLVRMMKMFAKLLHG
jgi:hypothetical protein